MMQTAAVPSEECSGESTQHGEHGRVDAANRERASLQMSGGGQSRGLQRTGARVRARVPVAEHAAEHAATHACNTRLPRSSDATASAAAFTRTHYCNTSAERSRTQRPSEGCGDYHTRSVRSAASAAVSSAFHLLRLLPALEQLACSLLFRG